MSGTAGASGLGPWAADLQDASWRGLPFVVRSSSIRRGRRVVVHEYPYRDIPWVEDLGRGTRVFGFTGYLIGDDVFAQRDAMVEAAETGGPGDLVHPSIGAVQANLVEFTAGERMERGRVVELEFSFIQSADQAVYPSDDDSTQDQTLDDADTADAGASDDFLSDVADAIALGSSVVSAGLGIVGQWIGLIDEAISDAAMIAGAVTGLPGANFGRYANGGRTVLQPTGTTAQSAIVALSTARAAVSVSAAATASAIPSDLPSGCQSLAEGVRATAGDPADQIRIISSLAAFSPVVLSLTAPIGAAIVTMQTATAALCRRAALTSLARASASYQPTSYDDAVERIQAITTLFDAEILAAADAGDMTTYLALRALRTAIVSDLIARGSLLPRVVTVTRAATLPSLVLAYQLYRDATRSDDLIARVNPVHPMFMPLSFRALAS